jgi:hypothetical protein
MPQNATFLSFYLVDNQLSSNSETLDKILKTNTKIFSRLKFKHVLIITKLIKICKAIYFLAFKNNQNKSDFYL